MATTEEQERALEGKLVTTGIVLLYFNLIALRFTQVISSVGVRDPEHLITALSWLFAASILIIILGFFVAVALALILGRYHPSKRYSLITSTAASIVLMGAGHMFLVFFIHVSRGNE